MPHIISIANQKGGVGKTSCLTSIAGALAVQHRKKVLVVDMDGQCNATSALLARTAPPTLTIKDVLWDARPVDDVMVRVPFDAPLFLVAGSPELAFWEKRLSEAQWDDIVAETREVLLAGMPDDVDVVLIDTPPTLGLWLNAALGSSDGCIVVVEPNKFSVDGLGQLMATFTQLKETVNPGLDFTGLLVNKARGGVREHEQFVASYRKQFGPLLFDPPVPLRIVMEQSQRASTPLEWYPDPKAAELRQWFGAIARQILDRCGLATSGPVPNASATSPLGTSPKRVGPVSSAEVVDSPPQGGARVTRTTRGRSV